MQLILAVGALSAFATSALAGPLHPPHKFWFPITKRANVSEIAGYSTPILLGNASIISPLDCNNEDTYLGFRRFDTPFNIATCAEACTNQSAYALDTSTNTSSNLACRFFNTYEISINSTVSGQICALYSLSYDATYATNTGYRDEATLYTISNSYSSSNATDAGTCVVDSPISTPGNSTTPPFGNGTSPTFPNATVPINAGNGTSVNGSLPLTPVPTVISPFPINGTNSTSIISDPIILPTGAPFPTANATAPTAGPTATSVPTVTVLPIPAPPSYGGYSPYTPPSYGPSSFSFSGIFGKVKKLFI